MFTKISHEERECVIAKEFNQLKAIAATEKEIQEEIVDKRQGGRPRKNTILICPSTIKQEEKHDAWKKKSQRYKRRGIHTTCGSPRTSFYRFKRQFRGMEGHKLQFTTWKLFLGHIEILVLTKN